MTDYISNVNAFIACLAALVGVALASLLKSIPELTGAVAVADSKIDKLEPKFDKLETQANKFFPEVTAAVSFANENIGKLDTRLDKIETKFDKLDTGVAALSNDVAALSNDVAALSNVVQQGFQELKGSMRQTDGKFVKISAKLQEDVDEKLKYAKKDQTKLHSRLSNRVKKLEEQVIPK